MQDNYTPSRSDNANFIRYLYQEGHRFGLHKNQHLYQEIIKFINTTEGIEAFRKFLQINPRRFGIEIKKPITFKKAF